MNLDWLPQLPLTDPIPIFLLVLLFILTAPVLNRLKIPHIVGLIFAGIIFGPFGLNVLENDKSFELFGKVGILYIMFLAGLEIDINSFKQNKEKGFVFGALTFLIPMIAGTLSAYYILRYDITTSILLASMYASHTLIAYPIVSRMGISKHRSISITIAGTIITVALSLIILAVIVASKQGEVNTYFWIKLGLSTALFAFIVFALLPKLSRWFLHRFSDNIQQYIFVLAIVFLASLLAQAAGLEGILGAFFAGLILNRLIPNISPLMNRIEFVGNAIFIPFFLISIGMLINVRAFFTSPHALLVAAVMTVVATLTKWLAAKGTQLAFKMSKTEGDLIFGLSNGQAAATLAAVLIGYRIGILNEDVLNGTVIMILITCSISSIVTERTARKLAIQLRNEEKELYSMAPEKVLIPVSNPQTTQSLLEMASLLKHQRNKYALSALNIVNQNNAEASAMGAKVLQEVAKTAASMDNQLETITRLEVNIANGIINTIQEKNITDVVLGFHRKSDFVDNFLGNQTERIINEVNQAIYIYKQTHPINTIKRLVIIVPSQAELEVGFEKWLSRIRNVSSQLSCKLEFYANKETSAHIKEVLLQSNDTIQAKFNELASWEDFLIVSKFVKRSDLVIVISARKATLSYHPLFVKLPYYLHKYFGDNNHMLLFPEQGATQEHS